MRLPVILLGICVAATFQSCNLVKTIAVPTNATTLYPYVNSKPVWTIQDATNKVRVIGEVSIRHDSIFGKLHSSRAMDHPDRHLYSNAVAPHSLIYMHLSGGTAQYSDTLGIPLSSLTSATTHKRAMGEMLLIRLVIFLGVILYFNT